MPRGQGDRKFLEYLRDVGARIRALRDELELSTEEAAHRAGLSPGYWGIVERGVKQPSLASLFKFAAALKVDVADLVAVGAARPGLLAKSRHRQIIEMLDEASAGQVKAIATCAIAILSLKTDPEFTRKGGDRKSSSAR